MEQPPALVAPVTPTGLASGAGFGIRFLARFIDVIVGFVLGLVGGFMGAVILIILEHAGSIEPGWQQRIRGLNAASFGLSLLGGCLYHSACEGIYGASLGKLVCQLRVVRADGRPCGIKQALMRSVAYFWDALFFGLVGYNSMKKSALNQRYGDVWAKTVVVPCSNVPLESERPIGLLFLGVCLGAACWISLLILGLILKAK